MISEQELKTYVHDIRWAITRLGDYYDFGASEETSKIHGEIERGLCHLLGEEYEWDLEDDEDEDTDTSDPAR